MRNINWELDEVVASIYIEFAIKNKLVRRYRCINWHETIHIQITYRILLIANVHLFFERENNERSAGQGKIFLEVM